MITFWWGFKRFLLPSLTWATRWKRPMTHLWASLERSWRMVKWDSYIPGLEAHGKMGETCSRNACRAWLDVSLFRYIPQKYIPYIYISRSQKTIVNYTGPVLQICFPKKQTWTPLCFHHKFHGLINFIPAIGENGWLALRVQLFYFLGPFNFGLICWFPNAETVPGTRNFMKKTGNVYSIYLAVYRIYDICVHIAFLCYWSCE